MVKNDEYSGDAETTAENGQGIRDFRVSASRFADIVLEKCIDTGSGSCKPQFVRFVYTHMVTKASTLSHAAGFHPEGGGRGFRPPTHNLCGISLLSFVLIQKLKVKSYLMN